MTRPLAVVIALLLAPVYLGAQETEPAEPGIVLPPTLLEVADLQVEEISAIVPDDDVHLMPELSIPLPKADEIFLPEEKFDIPFPDQLEGGQIGIVYRPERKADIFSEGEIAVGSMNHVRGDLNLYRLGPDPRFDLQFYHDKIDGYGLRSAGYGFFHSDDWLEGSLSIDTRGAAIEAAAGITESSEGLQGVVDDFEVLTYRRVYGDITVGYPLTEVLDLYGTMTSSYAQQILSSASSPSIESEIGAGASIGIELQTPRIGVDVSLLYGFLSATNPVHRIELDLSSDILLTDSLTLGLSVGVVWDSTIDFRLPFSTLVTWQPSDLLVLSAEGGYLVDFPTVGVLRSDYRFVELDGTLEPEYGWFAGADVQSRLGRSVILFGDARFQFLESGYAISSEISETTGLFPLVHIATATLLEADAGLDIEIGTNLAFSAGWTGRLLGDHPFEPKHGFTLALNLRGDGDTFGGDIRADIPLTLPMSLPVLGLSGYYRITESVRFSLDVVDPLAPILQDGRTYWGPYEAPGFLFYLATNISL